MAEKKFSKELIEKAQECKTPEELIELVKIENIELTKDQAEAYLVQMKDAELDSEDLKKSALVYWRRRQKLLS